MAVIRGVIKWCLSSGVEHRIANPVVMSSNLIGTSFFWGGGVPTRGSCVPSRTYSYFNEMRFNANFYYFGAHL